MIIDKQGKLFGKINIIDLFIIFIIISAIAILGIKFSSGVTTGGTTVPVTYTVKVEGIRKTSEKYFIPGEKVYNDKDEYMGEIVEINNVNEAVRYELTSKGEYKEVTDPSRIDLQVKIKANATENDKGFYIDGKISVLTGSTKYLSTKDIEFNGTVIDVSK